MELCPNSYPTFSSSRTMSILVLLSCTSMVSSIRDTQEWGTHMWVPWPIYFAERKLNKSYMLLLGSLYLLELSSSPASSIQLVRGTVNYHRSAREATCGLNEMEKDHLCPLFIKSDDTSEETAACLQWGMKKSMNYLLVQLVDIGEEWRGL